MRVIRWRGLQEINTLSPRTEKSSRVCLGSASECSESDFGAALTPQNSKGRPYPKTRNSQKKELLRETYKSISPKYDSRDRNLL